MNYFAKKKSSLCPRDSNGFKTQVTQLHIVQFQNYERSHFHPLTWLRGGDNTFGHNVLPASSILTFQASDQGKLRLETGTSPRLWTAFGQHGNLGVVGSVAAA